MCADVHTRAAESRVGQDLSGESTEMVLAAGPSMRKGQLDQALISQRKSLQDQTSFLVRFHLRPHEQLYQHNVLWATLGAQAAYIAKWLCSYTFWTPLWTRLQPCRPCRWGLQDHMEERKISNLDEFQTVVLVTVVENRKCIWGEREDSSLSSWRCPPAGTMGKGSPEFCSPVLSLHCCTFSGFGGPGGLCFSSCSRSPCLFWPSFLGAGP